MRSHALIALISLTAACVVTNDGDDGETTNATAATSDAGTTAAGSETGMCPATGIACTPECPDSGELPGGAPCTPGNYDPQSCECVPLEGGTAGTTAAEGTSGGDAGTGSDTGSQCPPTGVACTLDCPPEGGELPDGTPCAYGEFDAETCECVAPAGDSTTGGADCPATGIACTPDCPDSGMLPGGVPCTPGNFDPDTCECVPL